MEVIRGEGGILYPYKCMLVESDTGCICNLEGTSSVCNIERALGVEIIKALEHISQQIFELK